MQSENQIPITDQIISLTNSIQKKSLEDIRERLISLINELINKDFNALIQLLYRIDVDEKKIKIYLDKNTNYDSAPVIADLIIKRQLKKMESREYFNKKNSPESDEEKW